MQKTAVFSTLSSDKSDSDDGQTSIEEKKVPLFFFDGSSIKKVMMILK